MASYAYTFTSGDTVTPTKLNNARTVSEIVNADIKSDAAIAGSKLADGAITNAKVDTSAAIAGTKISPNFGSQNVITTGRVVSGHTGAVAVGNRTPQLQIGSPSSSSGTTAAIVGWNTVADFRLARTASATPGVYSALPASTQVAVIHFHGDDGTEFVPLAAIRADTDSGTVAAGSMPGRIQFYTTADGSNALTERMRITSAGRVGIGTNNPATTLEVLNPTGNTEYLRVGGGSLTERSLRFSAFVSNTVNNAGHDINAPEANGAITLSTVSTERLRIKTQGQVRFQPLASDPAGAEAGDVYYNSTSNKLRVRTNTAWVDLH
jgi:hypothetical protein